MTYVLPQVQVFQDFRALPTEVVDNLNAFVFGPQYELFRYAQSDEKALTALGAYDRTLDQTYAYPNKPAGSTVDVDYAKLYGDDVWLKYFEINADASNPVVAVSATERNKLRAAPRITDGGNALSGVVTYGVGGYHVGTIALPEVYYILPDETFGLGTAAGVMKYETTEGVEGTFDVGADATTSGVVVEGPDGVAFDFDNPDDVKAQLLATVESAGGASFTVGVKTGALKTHAEAAVVAAPYQVDVVSSGVASVAWTAGTKTLTIGFNGTTDDLATIRAAIVALGSDVTDYFEISEITGTTTEVATIAVDQDAVDLIDAGAVATVPDVIKIVVYENSFVFKTANGSNRSPSLYKDVAIGDRIVFTVTPASTGVEVTAETMIVGMEADYLRASADDPEAAAANQATVAGDDLSAGVANVAAGLDNQITDDFDYVNTKAFSLFATEDYRLGDLVNAILEDTVTMTVTKAGLKGVAQVSVTNASGTFTRTAVPVEDAGINDGRVYVGDGVYVDFVAGTGNPTGNFLVGDEYVVGPMKSPFTAVAAPTLGGSYAGQNDTVYNVAVTRGGKFDRAVESFPGITPTALAALTGDISAWAGGDVDDEYVLKCTTGGDLIVSTFELSSRRGDNMSGITFPGFGSSNKVSVGASGLKLYFSEDGGTPTFTAGEYFIVKVYASRPKVQVTDSAGADQEISTVVNDGETVSLGLNGLTVTFPANANDGLVTGDLFTVAAFASAAGAYQTLVLADELPLDVAAGTDADGDVNLTPDIVSGKLLLVQNSAMIPTEDHNPLSVAGSYNWEAIASQLGVNSGITLQDSRIVDNLGDMPFLEVYSMDMYVEYRALMTTYAGSISSISEITEVTALGEETPDNPLRLAVQAALENSGGTTVYFAAVPTDDADGYLSVLGKASVTDKVYAFSPATQDTAIQATIQAHVDAMSTETAKRWRRAFFGRDLPTDVGVVKASLNPGNVDYRATVEDDPRTGGDQFTRVVFTEDADLLSRVNVGDTVRLQYTTDAWGNVSYVTDTVAEIDSNTVLYLSGGLSSAVVTAQRTEVWHANSVAEIATAVANMSLAYADQRVCHVFPGQLGRSGTYVDALYGAASIAGLVSSVPPQQGLTNIELIGFDDVPLTYGTFDQDQLDEMAEAGTLIIMQETQGGEIFVRHQLTTAAQDGNLNTTELSMVKNLDSISYYFANLLKPYIGKYNVTDDLITTIETEIQDGLNFLGSLTGVGLLGPQLDLENTLIRTVEQHPTLKDRILAIVELDLPAPLNVIELHLVV